MKKTILLIQFLLLELFCSAQNDSLQNNDKVHFIIELAISPNLSFENCSYKGNSDDDGYKYKSPSLGCAITNSYGIQIKSHIIEMGFGLAYYSYNKESFNNTYKYMGANINSSLSMQSHYYFYRIPIKYCLFFEKRKNWFAGINTEISFLYKYSTHWHISEHGSTLNYENNFDSNQKVPQTIIWGGIEFGRRLRIKKYFSINLSVDFKYSTSINGDSKQFDDFGGDRYLSNRNLFVTSLNFSCLYKK